MAAPFANFIRDKKQSSLRRLFWEHHRENMEAGTKASRWKHQRTPSAKVARVCRVHSRLMKVRDIRLNKKIFISQAEKRV